MYPILTSIFGVWSKSWIISIDLFSTAQYNGVPENLKKKIYSDL